MFLSACLLKSEIRLPWDPEATGDTVVEAQRRRGGPLNIHAGTRFWLQSPTEALGMSYFEFDLSQI